MSFSKRLPLLFLATRLMIFMAMPTDSLRGFGDYWNFYHLAGLGRPFLDYWVEFPPLFPFLSALIYQLVGGRQHAFDYVLAILLSLAQAGNLYLFLRLARRFYTEAAAQRRGWLYFALVVGLFYGWGYFDPLAVFGLLLGLVLVLEERDTLAGLALAAGVLLKWFPALGVVLAWKRRPPRKAALLSLLVGVLSLGVYAVLYWRAPEMTSASLHAQFQRDSWQTVWALLDGNLTTGNLGEGIDHTDPATLELAAGNPPKVSSWLTLLPFAALGGWLFLRQRARHTQALLAFFGMALSIFFLWSPGWSPQWVLYLLPIILLVLPERRALLMALVWIAVNLLEWPVLLSRGYFEAIWFLAPLRFVLLILLAYEFWQVAQGNMELT